MRRIHAFELEDQPWMPRAIRDHATDFLRFMIEFGDSYALAVPILHRALDETGADRIVDLGSGDGPWLLLYGRVAGTKAWTSAGWSASWRPTRVAPERRRRARPFMRTDTYLFAGPSLAVLTSRTSSMKATEERLDVAGASLHLRSIGQGRPVVVLHGGPDFDHRYFLPDFDELGDAFRLIYYDQRGRGSSADGVRPEDVTLASELSDLDEVRKHFGLEAPVLLGHSWGAVLALEYALRYPMRLSHLILMNSAPVSAADIALMHSRYATLLADQLTRQSEIMAGDAYRQGDPTAVAARYRIHFTPAVRNRDHLDALMARMEAAFRRQGADGILKAWAIEARLMRETREVPGYDRLPRLARLRVPTLVIAGDQDFIPSEVPRHIADAIPGAKLTTIKRCGHFPFLERPGELRTALREFLQG